MTIGLKIHLKVALGFLSLAKLLRLNNAAHHQFGQMESQAGMLQPESAVSAAEGTRDLRAAELII